MLGIFPPLQEPHKQIIGGDSGCCHNLKKAKEKKRKEKFRAGIVPLFTLQVPPMHQVQFQMEVTLGSNHFLSSQRVLTWALHIDQGSEPRSKTLLSKTISILWATCYTRSLTSIKQILHNSAVEFKFYTFKSPNDC